MFGSALFAITMKRTFSSDETGLFYKLTPNQTLKFKGEKCVRGKLLKVRITILVCANMNGSEKQKLTVIGKTQKPRKIFDSDEELAKKKRKIVLLIDNCTAHIEPSNLQCIKVVFLPPNTTSVLQPMDQGVIRSLKCHYRKQFILRILECFDKNKDCDISLLHAVVLLEKSGRMVRESTIRNWFSHVGLTKTQQTEDDGKEDDNLPSPSG
ncbi:Tigger transposable element-derived protein 4 [Araneus ventricosus]|uniref:Tigger transposable element-derived protein 4 n=1 Tax=Araneus ventricosus TaxID=182803 RepID=A0A4Y2VC00_ARAVE|nr:Tigger transposable element-derived protein 4 [Araneus ventricosus]